MYSPSVRLISCHFHLYISCVGYIDISVAVCVSDIQHDREPVYIYLGKVLLNSRRIGYVKCSVKVEISINLCAHLEIGCFRLRKILSRYCVLEAAHLKIGAVCHRRKGAFADFCHAVRHKDARGGLRLGGGGRRRSRTLRKLAMDAAGRFCYNLRP